ncbi:MAG: type VI secretion system baseplate subunit TssE, partial [Desulfobacula sp.]|nr:type VI secretion system baseplate subunit TssE [Desulfobacula sp.]
MALKTGNLQESLLDRLIDLEPDKKVESVQSRHTDFRKIKSSVGRDLENLLNTRRYIFTPVETYSNTLKSLFVYGLPDFTILNPNILSAQSVLRMEIQKAITLFEPRLKKVNISIDSQSGDNGKLRFRISGFLQLDDIAEPVTFNTDFDRN